MVSVDEFDKMMDVATAAQIRLGLPVPFPTKEERIECFKVNRSAFFIPPWQAFVYFLMFFRAFFANSLVIIFQSGIGSE